MQNRSVSTSMSGMKNRVTLRRGIWIMARFRRWRAGGVSPRLLHRGADAPARRFFQCFSCAGSPPPSAWMSCRPSSTTQAGRMFTSAISSPLPVAVMAGA